MKVALHCTVHTVGGAALTLAIVAVIISNGKWLVDVD